MWLFKWSTFSNRSRSLATWSFKWISNSNRRLSRNRGLQRYLNQSTPRWHNWHHPPQLGSIHWQCHSRLNGAMHCNDTGLHLSR